MPQKIYAMCEYKNCFFTGEKKSVFIYSKILNTA